MIVGVYGESRQIQLDDDKEDLSGKLGTKLDIAV
jgi:hypothetical protein